MPSTLDVLVDVAFDVTWDRDLADGSKGVLVGTVLMFYSRFT